MKFSRCEGSDKLAGGFQDAENGLFDKPPAFFPALTCTWNISLTLSQDWSQYQKNTIGNAIFLHGLSAFAIMIPTAMAIKATRIMGAATSLKTRKTCRVSRIWLANLASQTWTPVSTHT